MDSIEEKRVFGDRSGALEVYVASSIGVVRVRVAGDTVGEFGLCERCDTRDVAATADSVAIATDEDVRVLEVKPEQTVPAAPTESSSTPGSVRRSPSAPTGRRCWPPTPREGSLAGVQTARGRI